jgi:hypothetical protein
VALTVAVAGAVAALRRRPRLEVELDPNLADAGPTLTKVADKDCAYFRLRVRNARGKDAARGVSVVLDRVTAQDGAKYTSLAGMSLAWSNRKFTDPNAEPEPLTVEPGAAKLVDLVHLNEAVPAKMLLDVRPQPPDRRNYLDAAQLALEIVVNAENRDPRRYVARLSFDGGHWSGTAEDAMDHLHVEAPQLVR